jgi:DNA-binding NarL/FixJ family response regulator
VLVVDDEALIRAGFRVLVDAVPGLAVVGEAGDGAEAVRLVGRLHPDVVLMDVRMPIMDGLDATRRIAEQQSGSRTRVLVVTTFDRDEYVFEALRAGASGFVLKDTPPEQLVDAIRVVAAGESLLAPSVTRRLISEFVRRPAPSSGSPGAPGSDAARALGSLTVREREVLVAVAAGQSNAELAASLFMSPATAKTHVSRLLAKLGARDRAQLVVAAYEYGVVTPHGDL